MRSFANSVSSDFIQTSKHGLFQTKKKETTTYKQAHTKDENQQHVQNGEEYNVMYSTCLPIYLFVKSLKASGDASKESIPVQSLP